MTEATISEIPVRLFAKQPTPTEVGDLVSRWNDEKIAEFLSAFGEGVKNRSPVGSRKPGAIGAALARHEADVLDGSGSGLVNGVASGHAGEILAIEKYEEENS